MRSCFLIGGALLALASCAERNPNDSAPDEAGGAGAPGTSGSKNGGEAGTSAGGALESFACAKEEHFASEVLDFSFGEGQSFGRDNFPEWVLGGPRGNSQGAGATSHIVSLGDGGSVTLGFGPAEVIDGPGPDLLVFENPFYIGGDPNTPFAEPAEVSVSEDGLHFIPFPCDPVSLQGCAGVTPVLANVETNDRDPLDPEQAGGDAFDLADIGVQRARFVRIVDVPGDRSALGGVFDLDAVALVHAECR